MVLPGNHETECHSPICLNTPEYREALRNFTAYNARFRMPSAESGTALCMSLCAHICAPYWSAMCRLCGGIRHPPTARLLLSVPPSLPPSLPLTGATAKNMWYSFNYGPVHFVSFDTETDFDNAPEGEQGRGGLPSGGFAANGTQVAWLAADLAKVRPCCSVCWMLHTRNCADAVRGSDLWKAALQLMRTLLFVLVAVCKPPCVLLQAAANRAQRPWIIVSGHRPIYNPRACSPEGAPLGDNKYLQEAIEDLLHKYDVDMYFAGTAQTRSPQTQRLFSLPALTSAPSPWPHADRLCRLSVCVPVSSRLAFVGHVHAYFRTYPVYNNVVQTTYDYPTEPMHLIVGSAGCDELHNKTVSAVELVDAKWLAARDEEYYGMGIIHVENSTTLTFHLHRKH
jgi:hypothetical protein